MKTIGRVAKFRFPNLQVVDNKGTHLNPTVSTTYVQLIENKRFHMSNVTK